MLNNLSVLENLNTLYVEDDKITKDIVSELLQNFFPNLISVSNGECAYDIYKKEKIDLIITDLEMPKLGGLDLISKIRTENYHLPIIVFTAYTDKKHLMPCANFNIQGYLEKPITSQKLKTIFENILTYVSENIKTFILGDINYDPNNSFILKNEEEVFLSKKEKMFLDLLILNQDKIVSYEKIERELWESEEEVMTSMALRTLVKNLRKKTSKEYIQNISGLGYKLVTKK